MARRPRGTGTLEARRDEAGRETWYGRFYVAGRRVKKRIGLKREPGTKEGLTHAQASKELRRLMDVTRWTPPAERRLTLEDAGTRYIAHLELLGRKPTTLTDYRSYLRIQLEPFFVGRSLDAITTGDVRSFIAARTRDGKSAKSIRNWLTLLHAVFAYAEREGWTGHNPVKLVEKPRAGATDPDIRFLTLTELDSLLANTGKGPFGKSDRVLFMVAAMTGARQGELLALRWIDVDWSAMRLRIRRSYVRGEFGTPKSKRSSRSVPLDDRAGAELEAHWKRSGWKGDEDLVFPNPVTGEPLDPSALLRRFKAALEAAKVREVRFHDLRHSFGTCMAAAGVPMRTLQEWMGHSSIQTTLIYADYQPSEHEAEFVRRAFRPVVPNGGPKVRKPQSTSTTLKVL